MSYIGVFDSGIGGLSIFKELYKKFPNYEFVYLADTKNMPYGDKTREYLQDVFDKNMVFFEDSQATILACNTISSFLTTETKAYGIIKSLAQTVKKTPNITALGILATSHTVNSGIYLKELNGVDFPVHQVAAPKLALAIEQGTSDQTEILDQYLSEFPKEVSHIVLACTHYNLLIDHAKKNRFEIIDPYMEILQVLDNFTQEDKEIKPVRFLTTKLDTHLQKRSEEIMEKKIQWEEISI